MPSLDPTTNNVTLPHTKLLVVPNIVDKKLIYRAYYIWSYRATSSSSAHMADGLSVWLVRQSGILARQLAESNYWREQFQTISEDVSVRNVLMHSAH